MYKYFLGFDNGVTGTIAILGLDEIIFEKMPVRVVTDFNIGKKKNISRIDIDKLCGILNDNIPLFHEQYSKNCFAVIERPLKNPARFDASISAARSFEVLLIVMDKFEIGYEVVDSKKWQKQFIPNNIKGSTELKKASMEIGIRMFPSVKDKIKKHKDADGLLIAEYCRLKYKSL